MPLASRLRALFTGRRNEPAAPPAREIPFQELSTEEQMRLVIGNLQRFGGWEDIMGADYLLEDVLRSGKVSASHPLLEELWQVAGRGASFPGIVHRLILPLPGLRPQDLVRILETEPDTKTIVHVLSHPVAEEQVWLRAVRLHPPYLGMAEVLSRTPRALALPEVRAFIVRAAKEDPEQMAPFLRIAQGEEFSHSLHRLVATRPREAARLLSELEPSPSRPVARAHLLPLLASEEAEVRLQATRLLAHLEGTPAPSPQQISPSIRPAPHR